MYICYLIALIPVILGFVLWIRSPKINIQEWLVGSAVGFIISGIFHLFAVFGMTGDTQTVSGQINKATFHPQWVERYTRRTKVGKNSYVTTVHYRTHAEFWDINDTLNQCHKISKPYFDNICQKFNSPPVTTSTHKGGFHSGDPNIYVSTPKTDYIFPTIGIESFENKVKAAPSVFSYPKIDDKLNVYRYPSCEKWDRSNRILGDAGTINIEEWDRMNTRLHRILRVNVIIVFYKDKGSEYGNYQEARWFGAKKNDLVLCYGGPDGFDAKWVKVFGWTDKTLVKRNLETILLKNSVDTGILPKIEAEILQNYRMKDWSHFDYLTIEPPFFAYVILIVCMLLVQGSYWWWAYHNEFEDNIHGF